MLHQGNVKLIGEPFPQLALGAAPAGLAQDGPAVTQLLRTQLTDPNAAFARIYGFSFEGHYYDLPRPVLMLVHGGGTPVGAPSPPIGDSDEAARLWEFSAGLQQWNYDKATMSIRLDIESGTLEQILLEARLFGDDAQSYYSASNARVSGSNTRVSGSNTRVSGSNTRVSGSNTRLGG